VADGYVSVVGSTNLDFRSFLFNSECDLLILDEGTAGVMEDAFRRDLESAEEIRLDAWHRRPLLDRLADRAARWLSPVL
jgi:cardiolipin synthase